MFNNEEFDEYWWVGVCCQEWPGYKHLINLIGKGEKVNNIVLFLTHGGMRR
jgi:hypothetical protein